MNQGNMQNRIRQITPEEISQAQQLKQLSPEELQKTQVLNLKDVEEAVRYEKKNSRKPVIIITIIGILFLVMGTTFQIIPKLSSKENRAIEKRERRDTSDELLKNFVPEKTSMNCFMEGKNGLDGTDTKFTITYSFENKKLIGFTKMFNVNQTIGNPAGQEAIANYLTGYQSLLNPIPGYQISVVPNGNGFVTTVQVDFKTINLMNLAPIQQQHFSTSIDYAMDTAYNTIKNDMIAKGYNCN